MAKLVKFKYVIVCLVVLAVISSITAFSVSYAKWTGGNTEVSASGSTGSWNYQPNINDIEYNYAIVFASGKYVELKELQSTIGSNGFGCEFNTTEYGKEFWFVYTREGIKQYTNPDIKDFDIVEKVSTDNGGYSGTKYRLFFDGVYSVELDYGGFRISRIG